MAERVILEGFHAVKHALRFGAKIETILALPSSNWHEIADVLAPDVVAGIESSLRLVDETEFAKYSPRRHPTGIVALADRSVYEDGWIEMIRDPVILLEEPRRLGNVGAVVRVAAAAGAGGVLTTGQVDPWSSEAIRGSAGLHFALPVAKIDLDNVSGPIIGFDAEGENIRTAEITNGAVLAFGTERDGLSLELRAKADRIVSLPMREGVSSLNLATSVAAVLYYLKLARD